MQSGHIERTAQSERFGVSSSEKQQKKQKNRTLCARAVRDTLRSLVALLDFTLLNQ